jgi:GTP1/Obg family GTP-binding protein
MRTVRENIKLILEMTERVFKKTEEIQHLINNESPSLSIEDHSKISELLSKQDIEIDRIKFFVGELVETFVGEDNYKSFMGENVEELVETLTDDLPDAPEDIFNFSKEHLKRIHFIVEQLNLDLHSDSKARKIAAVVMINSIMKFLSDEETADNLINGENND